MLAIYKEVFPKDFRADNSLRDRVDRDKRGTENWDLLRVSTAELPEHRTYV